MDSGLHYQRKPKTKPGTTVEALESQQRKAGPSIPFNSMYEPVAIRYLPKTLEDHVITEDWEYGVISLGRKGGGGGLGRGAAESGSEDLLIETKQN